MIQLVIFDMAGTAVNEDNTVYKTIQSALLEFGYKISLEDVLLYGAGKEKLTAIKDILIGVGQETSDEKAVCIHHLFKEQLETAYDTADIQLFESVARLIPELRAQGIKVAFNTGYKRAMAQFLIDTMDVSIGEDIDMLVASDDVEKGRPHPDMIDLILEQLNIAPENAIKVGDSAIDIEEGKNANLKMTVGITTGAQKKEQLSTANPDYIIDDMSELSSIING